MGTCTFPLGVNQSGHNVKDNKLSVTTIIAPSTSYATGGDTVPLTALGLNVVDSMLVEAGVTALTPGLSVQLLGTPKVPLLKVFDASNTEVASLSNNSARLVNVIFFGS